MSDTVERPPKIKNIKTNQDWHRPFAIFDRVFCGYIAYILSRLYLVKALEYLGKLTLLVAAILYVYPGCRERREAAELNRKSRDYAAWVTLNSAIGRPGNAGRTDALNDLVSDRMSLEGISIVGGAVLDKLRLTNANLLRAMIDGLEVHDSDFSSARMDYVRANRFVAFSNNFCGTTFVSGNYTNAYFLHCDFSRADFSGCHFYASEFTDCKALSDSIFDGASFDGCNFTASLFSNANLTNATLTNCSILYCTFNSSLLRTRLHSVDFFSCSFSDPPNEIGLYPGDTNVQFTVRYSNSSAKRTSEFAHLVASSWNGGRLSSNAQFFCVFAMTPDEWVKAVGALDHLKVAYPGEDTKKGWTNEFREVLIQYRLWDGTLYWPRKYLPLSAAPRRP